MARACGFRLVCVDVQVLLFTFTYDGVKKFVLARWRVLICLFCCFLGGLRCFEAFVLSLYWCVYYLFFCGFSDIFRKRFTKMASRNTSIFENCACRSCWDALWLEDRCTRVNTTLETWTRAYYGSESRELCEKGWNCLLYWNFGGHSKKHEIRFRWSYYQRIKTTNK